MSNSIYVLRICEIIRSINDIQSGKMQLQKVLDNTISKQQCINIHNILKILRDMKDGGTFRLNTELYDSNGIPILLFRAVKEINHTEDSGFISLIFLDDKLDDIDKLASDINYFDIEFNANMVEYIDDLISLFGMVFYRYGNAFCDISNQRFELVKKIDS